MPQGRSFFDRPHRRRPNKVREPHIAPTVQTQLAPTKPRRDSVPRLGARSPLWERLPPLEVSTRPSRSSRGCCPRLGVTRDHLRAVTATFAIPGVRVPRVRGSLDRLSAPHHRRGLSSAWLQDLGRPRCCDDFINQVALVESGGHEHALLTERSSGFHLPGDSFLRGLNGSRRRPRLRT
jgi:hypothetical protein